MEGNIQIGINRTHPMKWNLKTIKKEVAGIINKYLMESTIKIQKGEEIKKLWPQNQ